MMLAHSAMQPSPDQVREIAAQARDQALAAQARALAAQERAFADAQRAQNEQGTTVERHGRNTIVHKDGKTINIDNETGRIVITRDDGGPATTIDPSQIVNGALGGLTAGTAPPGRFPRQGRDIPQGVFTLLSYIFTFVVVMALGVPLVRAFVRRMDRRVEPVPDREMGMRLDRIEQAIETMAVEVERVSEAQRYSARLLTERLPEPTRAIASAEQVR